MSRPVQRYSLPRYLVECAALPSDPNYCGEREHGAGRHEKPQPAVDAARSFVRTFDGDGYPRARVYKTPRKGNTSQYPGKMIFRCWRKMDGTYQEERLD